MKTKRSKVNSTNSAEEAMARSLDELAAFDKYSTEVAPILRRAVQEKWSPEKMFAEFGSLVAARMLTVALHDQDSGKAVQAARDVLDRHMGRAKEKTEVTHRYAALPDADIDLMLQSLEGDTSNDLSDSKLPKH